MNKGKSPLLFDSRRRDSGRDPSVPLPYVIYPLVREDEAQLLELSVLGITAEELLCCGDFVLILGVQEALGPNSPQLSQRPHFISFVHIGRTVGLSPQPEKTVVNRSTLYFQSWIISLLLHSVFSRKWTWLSRHFCKSLMK